MGRKRESPQLATKRGERLMPDKWPDDWEEPVVKRQIREDSEETERWTDDKERGKRVEKFEDQVSQEFEDEKETKGWEEGKKER
jgi:hypothetical protein